MYLICARSCGGYTDSDTGTADLDGRIAASRRKKKERKRTTNLGPRIRVLRIAPVEATALPSTAATAEDGGTVEVGPAAATEAGRTDVKVYICLAYLIHNWLFLFQNLLLF